MGKPTGFIDYEREDAKAIEPKERIKNFKEFHIPLSMEKQQIQQCRTGSATYSSRTSPL